MATKIIDNTVKPETIPFADVETGRWFHDRSDAENYRPGRPYRPADWRAYIAAHHTLDESLPPAANVSGLKDMEERLRFVRFPRVEDR